MTNYRLAQQIDQGLRRGHYRDPVSGGRLVRNLLIELDRLLEPPEVRGEKPPLEDPRRRRAAAIR